MAVAAIPTRAKTSSPTRAKTSSKASSKRVNSNLKRFLQDIQDHGFLLGPGSKYLYYHREDPYPMRARIRVDKNRIRFEERPDRIGEWRLLRSFRLLDELDATLASIDLVKPKRRR